MWGKEGLCNIGQKRNEKKEKNLSLLVCSRMQAMAAAGLVRLEGKHGRGDYVVERQGFEDPARGIKSL